MRSCDELRTSLWLDYNLKLIKMEANFGYGNQRKLPRMLTHLRESQPRTANPAPAHEEEARQQECVQQPFLAA